MQKTMSVSVVSLAWFAPEDYESLRALLPDRSWHDTYDEWLAVAQQAEKRAQSSNAHVVKVQIRPDEFTSWCASGGHSVNSQSMLTYANQLAALAYMDAQRN